VTALLDRFEGRVLVVGCGSGKEVEHLCRRGCDAYGIDAAPEAVALAEQRHPQLKGRFSVMDLYDLDLRRPRVVYDGLVANAVLVHLLDRADLGAVLRSFTALLRDGGRCFVRVLEKQGRQQELDIRNEKRPRWFVYFDQAELCAAADEAGFDLEFGPDRRAHARGYPGVAWISALLRRRDRAPVER
jgi:SAM-dependent methyltransferase